MRDLVASRPNLIPVGLGNSTTAIDLTVLAEPGGDVDGVTGAAQGTAATTAAVAAAATAAVAVAATAAVAAAAAAQTTAATADDDAGEVKDTKVTQTDTDDEGATSVKATKRGRALVEESDEDEGEDTKKSAKRSGKGQKSLKTEKSLKKDDAVHGELLQNLDE